MSASKYVVWIWQDQTGTIKYIGWGSAEYRHPADDVWTDRNKWASELNDWLRLLKTKPRRKKDYNNVVMGRDEARRLATELTQREAAKGNTLLSARPYNTYTGGGHGRCVMGPDMELYRSVRQAAKMAGVNASTITRWCADEQTEWEYFA